MTTGIEKARRDAKKKRIRIKKHDFTFTELRTIQLYLIEARIECENAINSLKTMDACLPTEGTQNNIRYWQNIASGMEHHIDRIVKKIGGPNAVNL